MFKKKKVILTHQKTIFSILIFYFTIVRDRKAWVLSEKGVDISIFPFQDHMDLPLIL